MLTISKYLIEESKQVQTIQTRSNSKFLHIRLENEKSKPEIYILEDTTSDIINKTIILCQEAFDIPYKMEDITFVGFYQIRNGLHKFWLFEVLPDDAKIAYKPVVINTTNNNTSTNLEDKPLQKYARVPKPDLNKIYTEQELMAMDSVRQLKLLTQHYGVRGKMNTIMSKTEQIKYILARQSGKTISPYDIIEKNMITNASINGMDDNSNNDFTTINPKIVYRNNDDPQLQK